MTLLALWTLAIATLTGVTCALAGVMLVVKREAFISEALSHAVLPGIVFGFLFFQNRNALLLILSAALCGLLMIGLVQLINRTGLVKKDATLGIVFSAMFSVGVIASNLNLQNIHFHADCIIEGNLALAILDEFHLFGWNLGPQACVTMTVCLVVLLGFTIGFYKELKLMAFDPKLAQQFGFRPHLIHTCWLMLVAIVAVAAFKTAGSILVVALMIAPPTAASLLTSRLSSMFLISAILGGLSAALGVLLMLQLKIAPAGPIASMAGAVFVVIVLLAPKKGLIAGWRRRVRQRKLILSLIQDDKK